MKGGFGVLIAVVSLWIAAILQVTVAPRLSIGPGMPNFLLIVLGVLGLYGDRRGTTILGFGAGLIAGALFDVNLTLFVITRSLVGFLLGWFNALEVQTNYLSSAVATAVVTLIAELLLLFLGGYHGPIVSYLVGTVITTGFNALLSVPFFAVLSRIAIGAQRRAI